MLISIHNRDASSRAATKKGAQRKHMSAAVLLSTTMFSSYFYTLCTSARQLLSSHRKKCEPRVKNEVFGILSEFPSHRVDYLEMMSLAATFECDSRGSSQSRDRICYLSHSQILVIARQRHMLRDLGNVTGLPTTTDFGLGAAYHRRRPTNGGRGR